LAPPETIGKFEILREIGRGAMGVVYEARDPVLGRTVALKVIQAAAEGDELQGFEERFLDEAKIAAALQHPGIVVVHEVGRDTGTGTLFIALELLRGETLAELARAGPVHWERVMRIVAQVARALHHAHVQGVVHRDIKPANVIVLATGEAKVTDFGIARFESLRGRLTSTGQFIGTPLYTAPEQARVEEVDGRADVFSLASVAYTLLTGRPPFEAPTIPGIVHRVVYEEPVAPSRLVPELPTDVERILARALAKDPDHRYPSAEAFAEDAEDVVAGAPPRHAAGDDLVAVDDPASPHASGVPDGFARGTAAAPVAPDAPPAPHVGGPQPGGDTRTSLPPPRRRASRAPVVAAVAAILGVVALFLWAPRQPPPAPGASPPMPATPAPTAPAAAPAAAPVTAEPARLRIDFDHPLRRGRLRVFVDDELTLDERLTGQQKKTALVFKVHEGSLREELEVAPGLHEVRIEVSWDESKKMERIIGSFRAGATRRLDASLGRMRRDLTLEWHEP
jgi:serine/threonine-protein kinase